MFYFVLILFSLVMLTDIFQFFDLLGDIVKNHIPMSHVFQYLFFLSPQLIYMLLPISVLVAVLVTFGILTKNNEVTAFKACGVSLMRLGVPILMGSLLLSSRSLSFAPSITIGSRAPTSSRTACATKSRAGIRGAIRIPNREMDLRPELADLLLQVLRRRTRKNQCWACMSLNSIPTASICAVRSPPQQAEWHPEQRTWLFSNGRSKSLDGINDRNYKTFLTATFPQLTERPEYFLTDVTQDKQMNYRQLRNYIRDLRQRGFDTVRLRVQYYKKFAVPLFALIMAMLAVPFGFLVGNRGAMAGIGVSIGIAMAYWGLDRLFEQIGDVGQLDPIVAAWAPDAVFALAGIYFLLRMRS